MKSLVAGLCCAGVVHAVLADSTPLSPEVARAVERIKASRSHRTAEDRKAANELRATGDQAYKRGDYLAAYRAYFNAYPNYPTAYAYLMAGDSQWRLVVDAYEHRENRPPEEALPECLQATPAFIDDMKLKLMQNQGVGLALAEREGDRKFRASTLVSRSRQSSACLQSLVKDLEVRPANSCVDLSALRACLGRPLIP